MSRSLGGFCPPECLIRIHEKLPPLKRGWQFSRICCVDPSSTDYVKPRDPIASVRKAIWIRENSLKRPPLKMVWRSSRTSCVDPSFPSYVNPRDPLCLISNNYSDTWRAASAQNGLRVFPNFRCGPIPFELCKTNTMVMTPMPHFKDLLGYMESGLHSKWADGLPNLPLLTHTLRVM